MELPPFEEVIVLEFHICLVLVGVLYMVMHELAVFEVHVKGNKVLGFAAFSLWYLCSQVVTYSLLVHV